MGADLYYAARRDDFWSYLVERQNIWYRRFQVGQPFPWTQDSVLQRQHFSNVYRALDPTSQWITHQVLETDYPVRDRIFNVVLHRMINMERTSRRLGFWLLDEFDELLFLKRLQEILTETDGELLVSVRFQPTGRGNIGGKSREATFARVAARCAADFDARLDRLRLPGPDLIFDQVRDWHGIGVFSAHQIVQDLFQPVEMDGGRPLLGDANWTNLIAPMITTDCRDGVCLLTGEGEKERQSEAVFPIWKEHEAALTAREFLWQYCDLKQVLLTVGDIVGCIHNFHRYWRFQHGLRTAHLTYRPPEVRHRRKR